MTIPGVSSYSSLMIHAEIGEVERFDKAEHLVCHAGLNQLLRSPERVELMTASANKEAVTFGTSR